MTMHHKIFDRGFDCSGSCSHLALCGDLASLACPRGEADLRWSAYHCPICRTNRTGPDDEPSAAIKRVVHYNLFEGPPQDRPQRQDRPGFGQKLQVSKDGKEYTFLLHPRIKFHDGKPCTAEDVKFSFDRILDPKTAAPYRMFYEGDRIGAGRRSPEGEIRLKK